MNGRLMWHLAFIVLLLAVSAGLTAGLDTALPQAHDPTSDYGGEILDAGRAGKDVVHFGGFHRISMYSRLPVCLIVPEVCEIIP